MPTEGAAAPFVSQIIEIDRALENLAKSGKIQHAPRTSSFTPSSHYQSQQGSSRFPNSNYYGSQRAMQPSNPRYKGYAGIQGNYYTPPPPMQQQYTHQPPSMNYPGSRHHSALQAPSLLSSYEQDTFPPAFAPPTRYDNSSSSHDRMFSPFATSSLASALPPLSSNTPSYPPGYGSTSNSRAPSMSGSLSGSGSQLHSLHHSRAQSHSNMSDSGRTLNGITSYGMTSPPGHSRAASITGSASSPAPSTASFNFFGPSMNNSTSLQSSATSAGLASSRDQKITPIGRPTHSKTASSDTIGSSRLKNGSGHASGVTSPLGAAFDNDPWLGSAANGQSSATSTNIEVHAHKGLAGVANVWN